MKTEDVYYLWHEGQVVIFSFTSNLLEVLRDCFCVDASCVTPKYRYGSIRRNSGFWKSIPFDEFPAEFRTQLLLLGVS